MCGTSHLTFPQFQEEWRHYLPTELSPLTPWREIAPEVMYSGYFHEEFEAGEFVHYGVSFEDGLVIATVSKED